MAGDLGKIEKFPAYREKPGICPPAMKLPSFPVCPERVG
jgi:hypothetical protein